MIPKDFKSKGITWVENFYQKLETFYHEVDNIVTQDAVKYVEGQVHTVGENMKKLYSDVFEDLIPPPGSPGRCETEAVAQKSNAALGNCVKLISDIAEDHGINEALNQSLVEAQVPDPLNNNQSDAVVRITADEYHQFPAAALHLSSPDDEELQSSLQLETFYGNSTNDLSHVPHASGASKVETVCDNSADDPDYPTEVIDSDLENANDFHDEAAPTTSDHHEDQETSLKVGTACNNAADENASRTHQVRTEWDSSVCDSYIESDASSSVDISEFSSLAVSFEKKLEDMPLASSSSSMLTEPLTLSHFPIDNMCSNKVSSCEPDYSVGRNAVGSIVPACFKSMSDMLVQNEDVDVTTPTFDSLLLSELIGDSGMETIDLSDKVKAEDGCVIVDNSMLYNASFRQRGNKSYKKRLQDAFSSKRRLAKEYELLAITHGDLDVVSSRDAAQNPLSSRIIKASDGEWEIL